MSLGGPCSHLLGETRHQENGREKHLCCFCLGIIIFGERQHFIEILHCAHVSFFFFFFWPAFLKTLFCGGA